jgi:hypothetical protein
MGASMGRLQQAQHSPAPSSTYAVAGIAAGERACATNGASGSQWPASSDADTHSGASSQAPAATASSTCAGGPGRAEGQGF